MRVMVRFIAAFGAVLAVSRFAAAAPCTAPENRQFDFFAGDWDAFEGGKLVARNRVTPMLDGCAIREVYDGVDGNHGESFSTYDAGRRLWHQSWVTNHGQVLLLDGHLERDRMILTATETAPDGTSWLVRGVWIPGPDGVREIADRSYDHGKTWKPWFDITFRPHKS
jgi:hypothetical protein